MPLVVGGRACGHGRDDAGLASLYLTMFGYGHLTFGTCIRKIMVDLITAAPVV